MCSTARWRFLSQNSPAGYIGFPIEGSVCAYPPQQGIICAYLDSKLESSSGDIGGQSVGLRGIHSL
jgi:hypothetical protein